MAAKSSAYDVGINLIGEFVEDASSFKIVLKARDPRSFPKMRDVGFQSPKRDAKKSKKRKGK